MANNWGFIPKEGKSYFISYNSLDWQRIAPIASELVTMGYPVWYDLGLHAGTTTWREQISRHIDDAYAVILFVTKGIFDREQSYVINEYEEAKGIDKVVIPVFLDDIMLRDVMPKYRSYVPEWNGLQGVKSTNEDACVIACRIAEVINSVDSFVAVDRHEFERTTSVNWKKEWREPEVELSAPLNISPSRLVGTRVSFGNYPQSSNVPEPIVWRVLAMIDSKALMISENVLDCRQYNKEYAEVTWERSSIRKWLNEDFLFSAFDAEERKNISLATIENPNNPIFGTDGGRTTVDSVFCLSREEYQRYIKKDNEKTVRATAFARKNGCNVDGNLGSVMWWLRSPGRYGDNADVVMPDGDLGEVGLFVSGNGGVRPVILVQL